MIEKRGNCYALVMVKGDTETITVRMKTQNSDGSFTTKNFVKDDKLTLSVKRIGSSSASFSVTATASATVETLTITIPSTKTSGADASEFDYVFDIQCTFADGTIKTLVPRSPFILIEGVTD